MDKTLYNTLLLDFYGDLLTARRREIFDGYFAQNLTLGELAENLGVSRQAVNGALRATERLLAGYEAKLGLVAALARRQAAAAALAMRLDALADRVDGAELAEIRRLADALAREADV